METKDLTASSIQRQNILNNRLAIEKIQTTLDISGMFFEGEYWLTKKMVADFYEVDLSSIDRYVSANAEELKHNGYILCKGKRLKEFKLQFAHLINEVSKTTQLGLFNFRAFLNIGMLLSDSPRAKEIRRIILDLSIASIHEITGGGTKYINQRDIDYPHSASQEANYRKVFTSALSSYVEGHHTNKYAQATDAIYKAVFKENSREYRSLLKLHDNEHVRPTLYSEILLLIASLENAVGIAIEKSYTELGRKLLMEEVIDIINQEIDNPLLHPYITDARSKMASRDLGFREVYHAQIAQYLRAISCDEYERFIGNKSIDFDQILKANRDVLERLKQ